MINFLRLVCLRTCLFHPCVKILESKFFSFSTLKNDGGFFLQKAGAVEN